MTAGAHHHQRQQEVKADRHPLDEVQVEQRHAGDDQEDVLIEEVVVAHVFRQRVKPALPVHLRPRAEEGRVVGRLVIEHGDAREHQHSRRRADEEHRARVRALEAGKQARRHGIHRRIQRRERKRLPPAVQMRKARMHERRLHAKERQREQRKQRAASGAADG